MNLLDQQIKAVKQQQEKLNIQLKETQSRICAIASTTTMNGSDLIAQFDSICTSIISLKTQS